MKHWRSWGAVWILAVLFLVSWIGHFYTQFRAVSKSASENGRQFLWADFWPQFWSATFENWQSEFLQLVVQAILIASMMQKKFFTADYGADKGDIDKIVKMLEKIQQEEE